MNGQALLSKLLEAEKYFTRKEYINIVRLAKELFERDQFDLCERELEKLPTREQLLKNLVQKLEGKSVYKTIRKIQEGQVDNDLVTAKGLSSLLTHAIIEVEQGNVEHGILIPSILEKLNDIIYCVLSQSK
jgi:hypothetical protein